jgi:DNA-directed RNA polymerase beta subunit
MFANILTNSEYKDIVIPKKDVSYDLLGCRSEMHGKQGSHVTEDTVLVGLLAVMNASGQVTGYQDKAYTPKKGQHGVVDAVYRYTTPDGLHGVKIRVAVRITIVGDKFSARHGQKGTCGMRVMTEDMPYSKDGLIPDMIVNPHAFPSRMTIGQFIEMMSTKLGVPNGCYFRFVFK